MGPRKSSTLPFEEVSKVSKDYAVTAIRTLAGNPPLFGGSDNKPFRFIYVSGLFVRRDRAELEKNQMLVERGMVEYCAMRVRFSLIVPCTFFSFSRFFFSVCFFPL